MMNWKVGIFNFCDVLRLTLTPSHGGGYRRRAIQYTGEEDRGPSSPRDHRSKTYTGCQSDTHFHFDASF